MAAKPTDKKSQADLQQVVAPIKDANNVLVTISSNPTVDQLAACIGLTLVLNKMGKHATAVFSGQIPSTLEFLKPEETIEKNTDSLRDFIIALDKSKADKLRYKVEDDVVKIFITPYKTSIDEHDLEFSQGDFNVDVVVALGVEEKKHLDEVILAHGRILHDATVISINTQNDSHLGAINWFSREASSLCEMVTDVVQSLSNNILDTQNATALLTGIVAETDRYSNEKATPHTMSIAGALMSAGASTQLVSNELEATLKTQDFSDSSGSGNGLDSGGSSGELEIDHTEDDKQDSQQDEGSDSEVDQAAVANDTAPKSEADEYLEHLNLSEDPHKPSTDPDTNKTQEENASDPQAETKSDTKNKIVTGRLIKEPPHFTGQLTANTVPEDRQYTGSTDPLTNMPDSPLLGQKKSSGEEAPAEATPSESLEQKTDQTLREIEEAVSSPHLAQEEQITDSNSQPQDSGAAGVAQLSVDEARRAADIASAEGKQRPESRQDIGTNRLGADIEHNEPASGQSSSGTNPPPPVPPPIAPST